MLIVKSPELYINEYGILKEAGSYIAKYGKRFLIIAGKTAWKTVKGQLELSLKRNGTEYTTEIVEGYPTYRKVVELASKAYQYQSEAVIGIGGGKICDLAKAVGNFRNIPVITVPTVPATCACWAARSILYTEEGAFDFIQWNKENPRLVLADTDVLMKAPKRFLAAGVLDTLAKWYEFEPLLSQNKNDVLLHQIISTADVARQILHECGQRAMKDQASPEEQKQVIDAIFFLAGATGSFSCGKAYRGVAHPYYFISTGIPESRYQLHGEKVAFGLLVQFLLLKKEKPFIDRYLQELLDYRVTDTPNDWNVPDTDAVIRQMAEMLLEKWPVLKEKNFVRTVDEADRAIREASHLIESSRQLFGYEQAAKADCEYPLDSNQQ